MRQRPLGFLKWHRGCCEEMTSSASPQPEMTYHSSKLASAFEAQGTLPVVETPHSRCARCRRCGAKVPRPRRLHWNRRGRADGASPHRHRGRHGSVSVRVDRQAAHEHRDADRQVGAPRSWCRMSACSPEPDRAVAAYMSASWGRPDLARKALSSEFEPAEN
jgi:hypothetical protein